MRRHGFARDSLIETLHTVQESFGYLDKISLRFFAESLRVPLSQAYGVATFYHLFTMKPPVLLLMSRQLYGRVTSVPIY